MEAYTFDQYPFLKEMGLSQENLGCYRNGQWSSTNGGEFIQVNPHNNNAISKTKLASLEDYEACIKDMKSEQARWMTTPAPARGEIVR